MAKTGISGRMIKGLVKVLLWIIKDRLDFEKENELTVAVIHRKKFYTVEQVIEVIEKNVK